MIRKVVGGIAFVVGIALASQSAWADGGLLGLPNPFGKSTSNSKVSGSPANSKKPTLINQLTEGAKNTANATWDFVTLKWLWGQQTNNTSSQTPKLYDRRKPSASSKTSTTSSWWNSLWGKKDSQPKTLSEWLSQRRPEP